MNKNDSIYIRGMQLECRIGVSARERRKKRVITTDIALRGNLTRAGKSDRLNDTIDYSVLVRAITIQTAKKTFCLLESLAERIAEICLADFKVKAVTVKVAKRGVLPNARSVEIEITRSRDFTGNPKIQKRLDSRFPPSRLRAEALQRAGAKLRYGGRRKVAGMTLHNT